MSSHKLAVVWGKKDGGKRGIRVSLENWPSNQNFYFNKLIYFNLIMPWVLFLQCSASSTYLEIILGLPFFPRTPPPPPLPSDSPVCSTIIPVTIATVKAWIRGTAAVTCNWKESYTLCVCACVFDFVKAPPGKSSLILTPPSHLRFPSPLFLTVSFLSPSSSQRLLSSFTSYICFYPSCSQSGFYISLNL